MLNEDVTISAYFQQEARTDDLDFYYFQQALAQYKPLMTKLVYQYVAKNRRHEFFVYAELALYEALQAYDSTRGPFSNCAYQYIKTALLREVRRDATFTKKHVPVEPQTLMLMAYDDSIPRHIEEVFERKIVAHVSEEELAFLYALYVDNYSYAEISARLDVPIETLKKRRQRLIARLTTRSHV